MEKGGPATTEVISEDERRKKHARVLPEIYFDIQSSITHAAAAKDVPEAPDYLSAYICDTRLSVSRTVYVLTSTGTVTSTYLSTYCIHTSADRGARGLRKAVFSGPIAGCQSRAAAEDPTPRPAC